MFFRKEIIKYSLNNSNKKYFLFRSEFRTKEGEINASGFINTITMGIWREHRYIPPRCSNADIESFYATIERQFFDLESFSSRENFFYKAQGLSIAASIR
jgi:hypothetical protein